MTYNSFVRSVISLSFVVASKTFRHQAASHVPKHGCLNVVFQSIRGIVKKLLLFANFADDKAGEDGKTLEVSFVRMFFNVYGLNYYI